MSIRTDYSFSSGNIPGGLVDMSPRKINSRTAEEKIGFGLGVVAGTTAGTSVKLPVSESTAAQFEGVAVNGGTNEFNLEGKVVVNKGGAIGILRFGNIYVRMAEGVEPKYGDSAYIITEGDEAGYFTNAAASTGTDSTDPKTVAIKGKFLSAASNGVAALELFNQSQN